MTARRLLVLLMFSLAAACGSSGGSGNTPDGANGDAVPGDAFDTWDGCLGLCTDAPPFNGTCQAGNPQCSDCMDNDGDGKTDGDDIECAGSLDNDESSFSTGIPGDNIDAVMQDCFFDGNSGSGDDGCEMHVCCLLGAMTKADCPIGANRYDKAECYQPFGQEPVPTKCAMECGKLTPPGCDCFGCCTLCDDNGCYDIATNPTTSPGCDETKISDPTICKRCTKNTMCGNDECGGSTCILCPGQDLSDLDPSCNNVSECPTGTVACGAGDTCAAQTFCSNGCCIGVIL